MDKAKVEAEAKIKVKAEVKVAKNKIHFEEKKFLQKKKQAKGFKIKTIKKTILKITIWLLVK